MTLGDPTSDTVLGLKGHRLWLGLGLTAIRRAFELYECLLVLFVVEVFVVRRCVQLPVLNRIHNKVAILPMRFVHSNHFFV